jgi:hypothetical protein
VTSNLSLTVRCLHCGSTPGSVCLGTPSPGRGQKSRVALRFSESHPVRVAMAAAVEAGAGEMVAAQAARWAVRADQPNREIPYLDVARTAVFDAARRSVASYRNQHPPAPGIDLNPDQPELELET